MFTPTNEQADAVSLAKKGLSFALEAKAGSGKSSTLKLIANALSHKRVLLTAFSAAVIADAKQAGFPRGVTIKSNHGLAFHAYGKPFMDAGRLSRRLTPKLAVEALGIATMSLPDDVTPMEVAHFVLATVMLFQQSADPKIATSHVKLPGSIRGPVRQDVGRLVFQLAQVLWRKMIDPVGSIPVQHDTYLKLWALSNPRLNADVVMVDEAQDANAVVMGVLKDFKGQMIIVGDKGQQVFSWRGAENSMVKFSVDRRASLTQSFRFGEKIGIAANAVLFGHQVLEPGADPGVKGWKEIDSTLGSVDRSKQYTVLARKNMTLIREIVENTGKVGVVGGVADLLRLVEGAGDLQANRRPLNCPDLIDFATWKEVEEYAETPAGRDFAVLVRLVTAMGVIRLKELLKSVDGNETDEASCDVLLSTAHKAKGREWPQVLLANDFPVPTDRDLGIEESCEDESEEKSGWTPEEANVLYVAVTRAKSVLDCENCDAWIDALERHDPDFEQTKRYLFERREAVAPGGSDNGTVVDPRQIVADLLAFIDGEGNEASVYEARDWLMSTQSKG